MPLDFVGVLSILFSVSCSLSEDDSIMLVELGKERVSCEFFLSKL
jgi:hypothetical protein